MLKLRRRPAPESVPVDVRQPPAGRVPVSATSVDPERTEDVAAWLRAEGTTACSPSVLRLP